MSHAIASLRFHRRGCRLSPSSRATSPPCSRGERDLIANAANTAALIYDALPGLNWAGFYLYKSGELVLGPFQGKPACVRIAIGKGVCGTAAARRDTVLVEDVHAFPGPHRLRFGVELRGRDPAAARRGTAGRARSRQPACTRASARATQRARTARTDLRRVVGWSRAPKAKKRARLIWTRLVDSPFRARSTS